jgi:hypothetical protein
VFLATILLALGSSARAGELDSEFGTKEKAIPAASSVAPAAPGSELDGETPTQACFFGRRRGFFGYGGYGFGLGFGRFGYGGFGGFGFGYPFGFGYGRGFGGFGYGRGFGGYGFHRGRW